MKINIGRLFFETEQILAFEQSNFFRSHVINLFLKDSKTLKNKGDYPDVQFKIVYGKAVIVAITDFPIKTLYKVFSQVNNIKLNNKTLPIKKRFMEAGEEILKIKETHNYQLITPLIAFNTDDSRKYLKYNKKEKQQLLTEALMHSLTSFSESVGWEITEQINLVHRLQLEPKKVLVKGKYKLAFFGEFTTNFYLPDLLGLGRHCDQGYGSCSRVRE